MSKQRIGLLGIILIAFFLRVWQLPQLPPGLWYDEAYNGLDALWLAETGQYVPFVVGNNGREAMWHYLLLLSVSVLGSTTFAIRWVGAIVGILTVPIMYRFALALAAPFIPQGEGERQRRWFALAAAGWLAVSWWHLLNSRAGFRPVLLPLVLMLGLYFFWRGWWGKSGSSAPKPALSLFLDFALAGFFLGLSQYTYLPARLAPLIFGGLILLWLWQRYRLNRRPAPDSTAEPAPLNRQPVKYLLGGILITAVVAGVTFLPLGRFFIDRPETFSSRTGDVIFQPDTLAEGIAHLLEGISLFVGAGHELYRHHLPGRAMLGWLEIPLFWLGLIFLLLPGRLRRPESHLILLGLLMMWLPALLASPPVHSLRPVGLMPFYYLIVTIGLVRLSLFVARIWPRTSTPQLKSLVLPVSCAIFIILTGLINGYDYFWRWASHPEVYKEYNTPLVDLTEQLIQLSQTTDILIPLHLYIHPTTRYLLHDTFTEVENLPSPDITRPVTMVAPLNTFQLLYVGNIPESPALVLLTKDKTGRGLAYVSRPPRAAEQLQLNDLLGSAQSKAEPFTDKLERVIALLVPLAEQDVPTVETLFEAEPLRTVRVNWADQARLDGYEVTPDLVEPNRPVTLNLYWRSLTELAFDHRLFIQIVDSAGNPINQWEGDAFGEDMYRWRPGGILPTQHTLWLGPDTPSGPYLMRLGFFDRRIGERLPLRVGSWANGGWTGEYISPETPPADQIHLGLFYVSTDGTDPRQPQTPLTATFVDAIDLVGVTLPQSKIENPQSKIEISFHWQARHPTEKPYTVFLQLLNDKGEVVAGWDSQPLNGLYPTNLWSPGEIIVDTFQLPLPDAGLPPGEYRLISGFYDFETGQRLLLAGGGDFAELGGFSIN